jgi:hypothetical protein
MHTVPYAFRTEFAIGKAEMNWAMHPLPMHRHEHGFTPSSLKFQGLCELALSPWVRLKKLPWNEAIGAELATRLPDKVRVPQRAGQSRLRPEVSSPLLGVTSYGRHFPGARSGDTFASDISPFEVELASYALPGFGEPSSRRIAGEVSGQAGSDPGQTAKSKVTCCSPLSGKGTVRERNAR